MKKSAQVNVPEGANPLLLDRETLNPYRFAYRVLRDRLRWDMRAEAWKSRRKLANLHRKYAGQKAVIVCNGPSLNQIDLTVLNGVYTFGLNKINLLFDRSAFRPASIVAVNPHVIEQNLEFYNQTNIPLFLDASAIDMIEGRRNVTFLKNSSEPRLARDCRLSIHQGFTVTCVAMQLAFHMGFSDVALIGCDHSFASSGNRNQVVTSGALDTNHFDPRYFAGGQKWQLPDLLGSEYFYKLADEMFTHDKRRLVNATVGGKLDLLQRMPLENWLKDEYVEK